MNLADFVHRLVAALDEARVPYMLAGSTASSFHGEPRTTQDVDLVIDTDPDGIRRLVARLSPDAYYVDERAALDALRRRSQFNVVDMATGWKADLIIRKARAYNEAEFARRHQADVLGVRLWIASPEDVVVSKLEWAARTGSDRQLRDVRGILAAKDGQLDLAYVERWVRELGLEDQWRALRP